MVEPAPDDVGVGADDVAEDLAQPEDDAPGPVEPDVTEPEVPPSLVESRVLKVAGRVWMDEERVALPEELSAQGALIAAPDSALHGHLGVDGAIYGVGRDGQWARRQPSWDAEAALGEVYDAAQDLDGAWLFSTDVGILFEAEDLLWPSPVSDVIQAPVSRLVRQGQVWWFASERGVFVWSDGIIDRVAPDGEASDAPVRHVALGPDPEDPQGEALWVAYGDSLYALRLVGDDDVAVWQVEVPLDGEVISLGADAEGFVWALTEGSVWMRRPGVLLGESRWVRWEMPERRQAQGMSVSSDGAVWVWTNLTIYRNTDRWLWEAAVVGLVGDVLAVSSGPQGAAWLTRAESLSLVFDSPPVSLVGVSAGDALDFMPALEVFAAREADVEGVTLSVDDGCGAQTLLAAPYRLTGAGLLWSDCLTPGPHTIHVAVSYGDGEQTGSLVVPFEWNARPDTITWEANVEPIYTQYCARAGCHVGGFEPDDYEGWVEKVESVIERVELNDTEPGSMPPNGARPTATEILLIRWWLEDGLLER